LILALACAAQRRAEDMTRRVGRRGAGEHHRLAMERLLDERQDVAPEPGLAGAENERRVAVVGAVRDHAARASSWTRPSTPSSSRPSTTW
jgi:hypothetical protein